MNRRQWIHHSALAALAAGLMPQVLAQPSTVATAANAKTLAALARPRAIVLFRHALAPGGGDPQGFQLGNCASQRNLSDEGRRKRSAWGNGCATTQYLCRRCGIRRGAVHATRLA